MLAWARKDAVLREMLFDHDEKDHWEITRRGLEILEKLQSGFRAGKLDVRQCYFWSAHFKARMCPDYQPSNADAKRPVPPKELTNEEVIELLNLPPDFSSDQSAAHPGTSD